MAATVYIYPTLGRDQMNSRILLHATTLEIDMNNSVPLGGNFLGQLDSSASLELLVSKEKEQVYPLKNWPHVAS